MAKLSLEDAVSGFRSNTTYNANNELIETTLNNKVLFRENPEGEPNQMLNALDMNNFPILNVGKSNDAGSLLTLQALADLKENVESSPVLDQIATRQVYNIDSGDVNATVEYAYGYVRFLSATAASLIVPHSSTANFLTGAEIHIRSVGVGLVTIVPATDVTINTPFGGTLVLAGPGATVTVKNVAENEWDLMGQVFAAA